MFLDSFSDEIVGMSWEWSFGSIFPESFDAIAVFRIVLGNKGSMGFFKVILNEFLKPEGVSLRECEQRGEGVEVVNVAISLELQQKSKEEAGDVLRSTLELDQLLSQGQRTNWRHVVEDHLLLRVDAPHPV